MAAERLLHVSGDIELIMGDCLDVMASLPPACASAVITDPPYMIGYKSIGSHNTKAGGMADALNAAWWYAEWMRMARRLLADDGYLCVFSNWRGLPVLMQAFSMVRWEIESMMIWDKASLGMCSKRQLRPSYECVLIAGMPESEIVDRRARDIYTCKWPGGLARTTGHPAEKPLDLMRHLVRLVSRPGGLVVDPFAGSGTTCLAAKIEGRKAIGIEADPVYYDMAVSRIRNHGDMEMCRG